MLHGTLNYAPTPLGRSPCAVIMSGADSLHRVSVPEAPGKNSLCLCIDYNRAICLRRCCCRICRFCAHPLCAGASKLTITAQAAATRCLKRRAESLHGHSIFWPWLRRRWIRCTGTGDWNSEIQLTDRYKRIESSFICTCIRNGPASLDFRQKWNSGIRIVAHAQ